MHSCKSVLLLAGAVMGLAALGHRTVRLVLLPHLADYLAHLQPLLDAQVTDRVLLCCPRAADDIRVPDCVACVHISCYKSSNDRHRQHSTSSRYWVANMQWCPVCVAQEVTGSTPAKVQDQLRRVEVLRCYSALRTAAACAVYADIAERCADHTTCVQTQKLLHRVSCVNFRCCQVKCSGKCCECRLADHLLMAQRMQQPDEQDGSQPSAPTNSSQEEDVAAQVPAAKSAVSTEPQPDGQDGAGQASAAKQPEEAVRALATVFPHVHQPATAAKKANPKLGPLDRRKRKPQASHADILAGLCIV